jgi:hypothetical protein
VAKIEHPEVMDENGKQKVGGLMDPKMGSKWHRLGKLDVTKVTGAFSHSLLTSLTFESSIDG